MDAPRRVAIVDDHALVGLAVGPLIGADPQLDYLGQVADLGELEALRPRPELVVLDLLLRDGSQPVQNVARAHALGAQVLVLTSGDNRYLVREVLRTPILGIVRKSAPPSQLIDAIRLAARGESVVTTDWAITADSDPELGSAPLRAREREVLALYASGLGAKQVATQLGISENTVNDHLKRIKLLYQRLGRPAGTKVELYQRGIEDGFLPVPSDA